MLDNDTKRKIDTARDILVGKVPDPKSQVEQITIALIYKFMDDMDNQSIELGGKPSFFTGDYARYAWNKIFDPHLGGHEMLALYAEAIIKLNQNPNLPQLFRDIFKNAYLPYRDPETLKLFLKTINEFHYDHSERLGDAFEYLLSVLGSQGDAGQFRTPRHIIDFMVQIINPQKYETILDPACGTAGFLISSYKHIIKENTKKFPGDMLKPEEQNRLLTNFKGYDISPDMVRLSLVNMYLHGFVRPQIFEYDTLTSEDRWNEYADVILANPPFMSPKGGIKPHKRFSVQSNRSEVLFVDYIAEHLTPTGRAAVIVPEGIIFQSATAYKSLRKMLVENYLFAVVSLPAGVFNPYSGVKTSILLMDKQLAKKTDSILFVKIENDGFDLGTQRRPIDKNDLPGALDCLNEWKKAILTMQDISNKKQDGEDKKNKNAKNPDNPENPVNNSESYLSGLKPFIESGMALIVKKEKLAENGEYNLTGDRYRITETRRHQKWPMVKLGEVIEYEQPTEYIVETENYSDDYNTPVLTAGKSFILGYTNESKGIFPKDKLPVIIFDDFTTATKYVDFPFKVKSSAMKILRATNKINIKFAYYLIQKISFNVTQHKRYWISEYSNLLIPLPPLEVQREIVTEIESYQKLIDGCRQVFESWKPDIQSYLDEELKEYNKKIEQDREDKNDKELEHPEHPIKPLDSWPMVKLGDVCVIIAGGTPSTNEKSYYDNGTIPWLKSEVCKDAIIESASTFITEQGLKNSSAKMLKANSTLIALVGATIGKTGFIKFTAAINQNVAGLYPLDLSKLSEFYLFYAAQSLYNRFMSLGKGNFKMANLSFVKSLVIPLPPLSVQQRIVEKIEAERKVIDGCRELIKTYEEKIKRVIDRVWGD